MKSLMYYYMQKWLLGSQYPMTVKWHGGTAADGLSVVSRNFPFCAIVVAKMKSLAECQLGVKYYISEK